jgi:DNA repair protein RadC
MWVGSCTKENASVEEKEYEKSKVIHIKNWPEGDRPREVLLEKGTEPLSDAALLAILLETGRRGKSAVALASEILSEMGGFRGLMSVTHEDLSKIRGMSKAKNARILAAMEIAKRQLRQPLEQSNVIRNLDDLFVYLKLTLGSLPRDEFRVLHLNRSKHLLADEILYKGTADPDYDYPKEIVEKALRKKAAALILAHHHPIDLPMADEDDIALTRAIVKACWDVEIPVIDHIIIGKNGFLSMKRHLPEIFEGEDEIA